MIRPWRRIPALAILLAVASAAHAQSPYPQIPTDWDLLMLKLVNAARTNPAAENQRRGTNYSHPAVPPLAYDPAVGRAAQNHTSWMVANNSLTHAEIAGTPGYSGASLGARINYVGYSWSAVGENILWRSNTPTINASLTQSNHVGWWNSTGHRDNLMSANYAVLGNSALNGSQHYATQNFARPLSGARTYLFGVFYDDLNNTGAWEPRGATDPNREGLAGVNYNVFQAGTSTLVGSGSTLANGAFSFRVGSGNYDVQFLPDGGTQWIYGVSLSGQNVDVGDIALAASSAPGDYNGDGLVDGRDLLAWQSAFGSTVVSPYDGADGNGSGMIDGGDILLWQRSLREAGVAPATAWVPEPSSIVLTLLSGAAAVILRRFRSSGI